MSQRSSSRRVLLRIGGLGIAGLAGCLFRGSDDTDDRSIQQTTGQRTDRRTRTSTPSSTTRESTTERPPTEEPTQEQTTEAQATETRTVEEETPDGSVDKRGGSVVLTFDDGLNSVYERAFPVMEEYGFSGLSAVVCDRVEVGESHSEGLTTEELTQMQDAGWEIGGHSYSEHPDFAELSESDLHRQCERQVEWLNEHGFLTEVPSVVYPYNSVNEHVADVCQEYFDIGFGSHTQPKDGIEDPLSVGRVKGHEPETAKQAIATAAENGHPTVLMYHDVAPNPQEENAISTETFRETMEHIDSYGDRLEVITPGELLYRLS